MYGKAPPLTALALILGTATALGSRPIDFRRLA